MSKPADPTASAIRAALKRLGLAACPLERVRPLPGGALELYLVPLAEPVVIPAVLQTKARRPKGDSTRGRQASIDTPTE